MRILLTGANGQLGRALRDSLPPLGEVICATRDGRLSGSDTGCETADFDHPCTLPALIGRIAPDVVVNAAAYTAVDLAESECEAAFRINTEAVAALAGTCAARNTLLVHYSTDYVFGGDDPRPRHEDDPVAPRNVYGASKLDGETTVRASGCRHLLLRTSWVYAAHGHNFLRTMLRLAGERDELRVVDDQVGSPTPAHWIAAATARMIADAGGHSGTWHLAAGGETSWCGFAEAIFDAAVQTGLLATAPDIIAIPSSGYPAPACRPASSRLDTGKLQRDFGIALPHWRQGLAEVIASLPTPSP